MAHENLLKVIQIVEECHPIQKWITQQARIELRELAGDDMQRLGFATTASGSGAPDEGGAK